MQIKKPLVQELMALTIYLSALTIAEPLAFGTDVAVSAKKVQIFFGQSLNFRK